MSCPSCGLHAVDDYQPHLHDCPARPINQGPPPQRRRRRRLRLGDRLAGLRERLTPRVERADLLTGIGALVLSCLLGAAIGTWGS